MDELAVCEDGVGTATGTTAGVGLDAGNARLRVRGDFGGTRGGLSSSGDLKIGEAESSIGDLPSYLVAGKSTMFRSGALGLFGIRRGAKAPGSNIDDLRYDLWAAALVAVGVLRSSLNSQSFESLLIARGVSDSRTEWHALPNEPLR